VNKVEFLENIYSRWGDFYVHYMLKPSESPGVITSGITEKWWDEMKLFSKLTDVEKKEVNLRRQTPEEVILDVEEKYRLEDIKTRLNMKGWIYECWDTGSRGFHFVLKFDNLVQEELVLRNRIRKYIIQEFQTDDKLAKESQWMALEWCDHFKTGKPKIPLEKKDGYNHLDQDIIDYCKKQLSLEVFTHSQPDDDFKDWHKTDPYLKYVLGHKIEDGNRNDILFKNFAIALVRSGLLKEDIGKIAQAVVNNCPGKSIGEFNGWVDKAMTGEIKDYNKAEILQWAMQYGHPLLYKMMDDQQLSEILPIKNIWDIIWDRRIARQPIWRDLVFYNMIGTILDEREEDYRIPIIFSCFSGTGKDEGINLEEQVLMSLGFKTSRPSSVTDKTLIGAPNQLIEEFNIKNNLSKENTMNKDKVYKDPIEYGLLYDMNWIAFGEAESVFTPASFNKQLQIILRQAMDKARHVEKGVAGKIVKFNTNTSFVFATYPLHNIISRLLYNGLFQRAIYYDKEITDDDHHEILKHINKIRFSTNIKENYDEKEYMSLLIEKLKSMKMWYNENNKKVKYFESCDEYINQKWFEFEDSYKNILPADKMILNSMVRRASNNLNKFIMIYAAWNMKNYITKDDVNECFKIFEITIGSIKNLLAKQDMIKKQQIVVLNILKDGSKATMNLYKELEDNLGIASPSTKAKLIKKMKDLGMVTAYTDGKHTMLSLTEKGREFTEEG